MSNYPRPTGSGGDIRSFLKNQHRKVYAVCRLFANNYKEQQQLFSSMLSAVSQSILGSRTENDRNILLLRACMNMAALHSISNHLKGSTQKEIQFKSPDFQKTMVNFRDAVGEISDLEKMHLFLQLENVPREKVGELTGIAHRPHTASSWDWSWTGKNLLPYIKQKFVWS